MGSDFERLYEKCGRTIERYIYCKVANSHDAEDIVQSVLLAGLQGYERLTEPANFKKWMLSIASHKLKDYYTEKAKRYAIPLEWIEEGDEKSFDSRDTVLDVRTTLQKLPDKDSEILYLFYIRGIPQKDIALRLCIPLGTVKSRLYSAKKHFAENYYDHTEKKEGKAMTDKTFPAFMPDYTIKKSEKPIFDIVYEEVPGWLVIARVGEKKSFAFYDDPDRRLTGVYTMETLRPAEIHGIDCVQIAVTEREEDGETNRHDLFIQLTESHCRYVANMKIEDGVLHFGSLMDDEWLDRYEVGENNCGRETHMTQSGEAVLNSDGSLTLKKEAVEKEKCFLIGRFDVTIGEKTFDTVAAEELYDNDHFVLRYIDKQGRTVLSRRFNRFDWKEERYGALWTDKLPNSERLIINGDTYVHWYDCIPENVI